MAAITVDTLAKGTQFDPELVSDLITKVRGKSSLAVLSGQTPLPFNGSKEFIFNMPNEIDIVAEGGAKSHGGMTMEPVIINPVKFEYGARVTEEFLYASEEEQLNILQAFNDGFAVKVARGLDLAGFHGINPRTGSASTIVGTNNFDSKVTQSVTYAAATADDNLDAAIALVQGSEGDVTGIAMCPAFAAAMGAIKANGIPQYPEFRFGGRPAAFAGLGLDVNKTVSDSGLTKAYVGDFANMFRWGYSKEIPLEIIPYGDPDNSGSDLKGHNQIYIRAEVYLGWGILDATAFAKIAASA